MAGRLFATLVVLAMLLTGPAAAQSIRVDGETATLVGEIEEDLPDRIASLPEDVRVLVLASVGGYTEAAFDAAKDIRARGLTTYVPEFCFSACTMLFQAGVRRIIGVKGSLMFHPSRPAQRRIRLLGWPHLHPIRPGPEVRRTLQRRGRAHSGSRPSHGCWSGHADRWPLIHQATLRSFSSMATRTSRRPL